MLNRDHRTEAEAFLSEALFLATVVAPLVAPVVRIWWHLMEWDGWGGVEIDECWETREEVGADG